MNIEINEGIRFRYFATCGTEQVELQRVYHDGHVSSAPRHFIGTCPSCGQKHPAERKIEMKRNPSKHECNAKCMNGSARGVCECSCGGKNHGVGSVARVAV